MNFTKEQANSIVLLYLNPQIKGSFGSVNQFHSYLTKEGFQISITALRALLREFIPALTINKPLQENFARRTLLVSKIDEVWQADLAVFPTPILRSNRIAGLLVVVDALTLYCFIEPVKKKTSIEVAKAFQEILKKRKPKVLITDMGSEFVGVHFKRILEDNGIIHQLAKQKPNKAHLAELQIKLIKKMIRNYQIQMKTKKFMDHLQDFVKSLNSRPLKRLMGASPIQIDYTNQNAVADELLQRSLKKKKNTGGFKIGDFVRLQLPRAVSTGQNRYTEEIFRISAVNKDQNPVMYVIEDLSNEKVNQMFYGAQLALVKRT